MKKEKLRDLVTLCSSGFTSSGGPRRITFEPARRASHAEPNLSFSVLHSSVVSCNCVWEVLAMGSDSTMSSFAVCAGSCQTAEG